MLRVAASARAGAKTHNQGPALHAIHPSALCSLLGHLPEPRGGRILPGVGTVPPDLDPLENSVFPTSLGQPTSRRLWSLSHMGVNLQVADNQVHPFLPAAR